MAISLDPSAVFGGIGSALSHPVYRRYWASNTVATTGRWMHRMAVGWLTWELTESSGWLGLIAFADTFPMVLFSILAGAVADRVGYLRVIRVSQFGTGCIATVFAALTLSGLISIEMVLVLTLLLGSTDALSMPARMSLVHSLVPRRDLSAAIALGSATFNAARLVGPAVAGALIVWFDVGGVIAIAALSFLQFFAVLLFVEAEEPERETGVSHDLVGDIVQAVRYVLGHPGIRFLMVLLAVTGLLIRPCIDLLPGFAAEVFGRGPDGLAILMSSIGFGATISGLWLAQRGHTAGLTRLVTVSLLIQGLALTCFTFAGFIWVAAAFLAVVGFFMLIGGIGSQTLIQNAVDSRMRARVLSLFIVISWGLPAFGSVAMGWLATFFGLQGTVAGGAVLAVAVWLWARRVEGPLAPGLEQPEEVPHPAAATAPRPLAAAAPTPPSPTGRR